MGHDRATTAVRADVDGRGELGTSHGQEFTAGGGVEVIARLDLTHASFFSGVGGLDLGFERAGWRTVSFSEIDPYASAVLAERWPGVPNLGDITAIASAEGQGGRGSTGVVGPSASTKDTGRGEQPRDGRDSDDDEVNEPRGGTQDGIGHRPGGRSESDIGSGQQDSSGYNHRADISNSTSTEGQGIRQPAGMEHSPCDDWRTATLWTGGFPCQDLSVAGKRRGMGTEDDRTRSGLAYAFLDLVRQHRPPAILLENVPGLLSSNAGRDFGALLDQMGNLGYWWAYRILDAQFFGVPQRRRRVFICALHAGAGFGPDSPGEVLSVGARCGGHSQESDQEGTGVADRFADGIGAAGPLPQAVTAKWYRGSSGPAGDEHHNMVVQRPSPDTSGVREAYGLAGRPHHISRLAPTINAPSKEGGWRYDADQVESPIAFRKSARAQHATEDDFETWVDDGIANTINSFDVGDTRTTHAVVGGTGGQPGESESLPLGLDSHRYRCCGNGVVSNVTEWIGTRLAGVLHR